MDKKYNKIFCIGLDRTGTSSLNKALNILGFESIHQYEVVERQMEKAIRHNKKLFHYLEHYDAFTDIPREKFKQIDRQYPESKFILTIRELENWIESRKKKARLLQKKPRAGRYLQEIDIPAWKKKWEKHNRRVLEHFKNRPQDLLVINICSGEGWEKLCPFLGKKIPEQKFPHENRIIEQK